MLPGIRRYRRWQHKLLARRAKRPSFSSEELRQHGYFSQNGQDRWLTEGLLAGKRKGVFLDIGAHDGVSLSNTCYLERELGWDGVAVEPNPAAFEKLRKNRQCAVLNGCVTGASGKAKFLLVAGKSEMLSGLVDEFQSGQQERIANCVPPEQVSEIEVECFTLNNILSDAGIRHVDYLSLDVEGGEFAILRATDFSRFSISIISVENHYRDERIPALLLSKGYRLHSIVGDEFYVRSMAGAGVPALAS